MLIERFQWTRQGGARINGGSPFANQLAFAWTGQSQNSEILAGQTVDVNATSPASALVASSSAVAAQCTTGQRNIEWSRQFITTSNGAGAGDFTMLVVANPASGNLAHLFAQKNDAGGSPFAQAALLANSNAAAASSGGSIAFFTFSSAGSGVASAGAVDGNWHVFVGRRVGASLTVWSDGRQLASSSPAIRTITQSAQRYTAIGSRGNGTTDAYGGQVALAYAWNRGLQDSEIVEISRNPWQLFAPRPIWVPVSSSTSGTSYTISPSGGITFAGTSVDVKTKVISPTGGVTFAGTGSMAFATTGTTYTISPTGGIAFAGTGTQVRSKTITPTGGITFSGSGLDLRTKIVSTSGGVTFGGTGSMTSNTTVVTGTVGERTKVGVGT